jgi:hypothetical protein
MQARRTLPIDVVQPFELHNFEHCSNVTITNSERYIVVIEAMHTIEADIRVYFLCSNSQPAVAISAQNKHLKTDVRNENNTTNIKNTKYKNTNQIFREELAATHWTHHHCAEAPPPMTMRHYDTPFGENKQKHRYR